MDILVEGLDPGQLYIFQARAKSVTGKTSAWSTAFKHTTLSDTIAPSPVGSLTWDAVGTSFVATWVRPTTDSNGKPLKDFRDYKVMVTDGVDTVSYYVSQEKFDFTFEANRNSFGSPVPDLDISVQVRDRVGNLSTAETENAVNPIPADVTGFVAEGVNNGVATTWEAVADTDLKYYRVHVSTSGAGFTPGPSNLVYTGSGTSFLLPSTNYVPHYFKITAVDVFDQLSSTYASDSATPASSSGVDLTPPDDPTNVEVTTAALDNGSSAIDVIWDAVGSSNLSDYLVRYSTDEAAWQYINVPAGQESATIDNLIPATDYYVQVAAMSQVNIKSDFVNADVYPIETAVDAAPPSQPAAPTVSVTTLAVQVSHDMTKQGGGDLESDVSYLEVHASTTTGFTPGNTTLRGTIDSAAPGVDVSGVFYFPATDAITNLYWKVIAVDRAKNKSTASNQATGTPGLVLNANIANATITTAKINDLEANKITAGTGIINNLAIKSTLTIDTAGHLQSTNWNGTDTGYKLDTGGLTIYSGSISASALLLQDSANLIPPAFADFEFSEDYYHTSGVANPVVSSTVGTGVALDILDTGGRFGSKCLRLLNGVITNPTVHDLIFAPSGLSATGVNIDVSPGTYIVSGYFKKNGSVNALLKFGLYPETGSAIVSSASTVNSTSWTRFEAQLVVPSGVSRVKAYIEFGPAAANTGYDFLVDGLQVERKMTAATSAGPWRAPSKTTIDGGQIVTGSIRSSSPSSIDITQPAWSINTAGNMQVGDALVRGSIVVGTPSSASVNIIPDQFASFEQSAAFYASPSNFGDPPATGTTFTWEQTGGVGGAVGAKFFRASSTTMLPAAQESVYFAPATVTSVSTNNIIFIPGKTYIISGYVKNMDVTKSTQVNFSVWENSSSWFTADHDPGTPGVQKVNISAMTSWTRISGTWTAHSQGSGKVVVEIKPLSGTGFNVGIDGLMIEEADVGVTTPSTWVSGYSDSSFISSSNYLPGQVGWKIDATGHAEFNSTLIRGALETKSELGSIEINLLDTRPTIKLWNDTFDNYAWINLVDDVTGHADIGINQGPHDSEEYPGTSIYSRLYLADSTYSSQLAFVRQSDQARIGGGFQWSDESAHIDVYDNSVAVKSSVELYSSGAIEIENQTSTPAYLRIISNGNVELSSTSRYAMSFERSTGIIRMQGGDGTGLNGFTFVIGGSGDPYFHIINEGWNTIALLGGRTGTVRYKLLATGEVIFRGTVSGGTNTVGQQLITTMPVGYRPIEGVRCHAPPGNAANGGHVQVATTGELVISQPNTTASYWLNDVRYSVI